MPLFSILSSQTVNCTRIRNKADMGLIIRFANLTILIHHRVVYVYYLICHYHLENNH